jgi:O-antigen/teichoic acid export membrane protein
MIARSIRIAAAVGTIVFVLAIVLGRFVLETVGGSDFGQAYHSLLWLTAAACIDLAMVAFEPSIMAAQRAHLLFLARLAATVVLIAAAIQLEPVLGADGIAAAVFANSVCQAVLLSVIVMRMTRGGKQATLPPA